MASISQDHVFVSYSHKDRKWLDELLVRLKPFLRDNLLTIWSDKQIYPGSKWLDEIEHALATTRVAILLVTPAFLASDFIHQQELSPLLRRAESGGAAVLWIPIRAANYETSPIHQYQALHDPKKPLAGLRLADRDAAWVRICEEIRRKLGELQPDLTQYNLAGHVHSEYFSEGHIREHWFRFLNTIVPPMMPREGVRVKRPTRHLPRLWYAILIIVLALAAAMVLWLLFGLMAGRSPPAGSTSTSSDRPGISHAAPRDEHKVDQKTEVGSGQIGDTTVELRDLSTIPDSLVVFDAEQWDEREVNKTAQVVGSPDRDFHVNLKKLSTIVDLRDAERSLVYSILGKGVLAISYHFSPARETGLRFEIPPTPQESPVLPRLSDYAQGSIVLRVRPALVAGQVSSDIRFGIKLRCSVDPGTSQSSNADWLWDGNGYPLPQGHTAGLTEWCSICIPIQPYLDKVSDVTRTGKEADSKHVIYLKEIYLVFGDEYSSPLSGEIRLNSICLSKAESLMWCKVGKILEGGVFYPDPAFPLTTGNPPRVGQGLTSVDTLVLYEMRQKSLVVHDQISKGCRIHIVDMKRDGDVLWARIDIVPP